MSWLSTIGVSGLLSRILIFFGLGVLFRSEIIGMLRHVRIPSKVFINVIDFPAAGKKTD